MRNFSNRFCKTISALLVVVAIFVFGSCTMTADNTLGSNIMPEDQVMVMRHLKIKGNTIVRYNPDTESNEEIDASLDGKNFVETRLYRTDSLLSSNLGVGYLGVRRSDTLGVRTAGFASSMLYMNAINEETGFGYKPIFDTMMLVMSIKNYGGDTLVPIRYKVYELKKPLVGDVLKYDEKREQDSIAYINCDLTPVYDESKPIFEFTFPKSELKQGPSTLMIPMENTEYSWDYARRLMLIPDNYADAGSDWDGYGRDSVEIYTDDERWTNKFYGLYIKPDLANTPSDKRGAFYEFDLSASGVMLQGRSRNPKDPSMIQDTVGMYYYFYDSESKYNTSVNKVEHDYSQGLTGASLLNSIEMGNSKSREERTRVSTCYVEGLGGPATEIYLTDDFLNELVALETTEQGEYSRLGINQCLLTIYVAGADYDWFVTQSRAEQLTPMLNSSFTRLGTYLNYNTLSPIIDYDYVYENTYNIETIYNGYLDRSRGCYILNITAHIQKVFNSMRQEDGTYDVSKADEKMRSLYIGTEATSPYALNESILQGEAGTNDAPIQFDLTYTLVK